MCFVHETRKLEGKKKRKKKKKKQYRDAPVLFFVAQIPVRY